MTLYQDVDITTEVEIELDVCEVYNALSKYEKEEMLDLLLQDYQNKNKEYYIESLVLGRTDTDILTNQKIWGKIIRLIKYDQPALKDFIIEELQYEPPK